ncbi:LIM-domain binding protein, partial [Dipodascopsis tothii]|uniref:LIM-domain binding protein n=1 Tax=Dipodascopsis tothii TaxID=44089 RepID=UPI0034CE7589
GNALLRLILYCEHMSAGTEQQKDLDFWRKFVQEYFTEMGVLKHSVTDPVTKEQAVYEVPNAALPRYYRTLFQEGIKRVQLIPENPREVVVNPNVHVIDCTRTTVIYWFQNGSHVVCHGSLRIFTNAAYRFDSFEFHAHDFAEFMSKSVLVNTLKTQQANVGQADAPSVAELLPKRLVNGFGITDTMKRFFQVTQVMSQMRELVPFYMAQ